jgi:hypothetical protein
MVVFQAGDAFGAANMALDKKGLQRLFCKPDEVVITDTQYIELLEGFVEEHPKLGAKPMGSYETYLLVALQEKFPCGK